MKKIGYVIVTVGVIVLAGGCGSESSARKSGTIRLATTTSTENSGLLNVLLPAFQDDTGIEVHVMPMGTGKALQTARDGNCDVVLVHAPQAEKQFVQEGWGLARHRVMYNDFVILGPASDPAGVREAGSADAAMKRIAATKSVFVSRGDRSGTHQKELDLWRTAGLSPEAPWYRSVGKGMGETLTMAGEMQAYVLSDRGTFISFRGKIELGIVSAGDRELHNPYHAIAVNPDRHPHVRHRDAARFIDFLTGDKAQKIIGDYRLAGEILFHPWSQDGGGQGDS